MFTRKCDACGTEYQAKQKDSRFCGAICSQKVRRVRRREMIACLVCSKEFLQNSISQCCSAPCRDKHRKTYRSEWKKRPPTGANISIPTRCTECPSRDHWGRCGAVLRGPMQGIQAVAVRIGGNCPRLHGVRSDIELWVRRRNNLHLPPLDGHRRIVGKPGSYIEEVKIYE